MSLEQQHKDDGKYQELQSRQLEDWEALCRHCGACCGIVDGDPCEHLIETAQRRYSCQIYENRLGMHKTRSGRPFQCVPLRNILHKSWPGDRTCPYKRQRP